MDFNTFEQQFVPFCEAPNIACVRQGPIIKQLNI